MSTNTNSNVSNTRDYAEMAKSYIKHSNGSLFQVLTSKDNPGKVRLRTRNKYEEFSETSIKQGIVDGRWTYPNEHEVKKHIEAEEKYLTELTHRLVKRVLMTQLLMELDDDLKKDYADDKYMRSILDRSEKAFFRLTEGAYGKMYNIDKTMLQNFMKHIDTFTSKCAKVPLHEFYHLNDMMEKYLANPEAYQAEKIILEENG